MIVAAAEFRVNRPGLLALAAPAKSMHPDAQMVYDFQKPVLMIIDCQGHYTTAPLLKVIPVANIPFASEMVGAVKGIDPDTGHFFDDAKPTSIG